MSVGSLRTGPVGGIRGTGRGSGSVCGSEDRTTTGRSSVGVGGCASGSGAVMCNGPARVTGRPVERVAKSLVVAAARQLLRRDGPHTVVSAPLTEPHQLFYLKHLAQSKFL